MSGEEGRQERARFGPLGQRFVDVAVEDLHAYAAYERRRSERMARVQALEDELADAVATPGRPLVELLAAGATSGVTHEEAVAHLRVGELLALIRAELLAMAEDAERQHVDRTHRVVLLSDLAVEAIRMVEGEQGLGAVITDLRADLARTRARVPTFGVANDARREAQVKRARLAVQMDREGYSYDEIAAAVGARMPGGRVSAKTLERYGVIRRPG